MTWALDYKYNWIRLCYSSLFDLLSLCYCLNFLWFFFLYVFVNDFRIAYKKFFKLMFLITSFDKIRKFDELFNFLSAI